jgi:hypothetical protein
LVLVVRAVLQGQRLTMVLLAQQATLQHSEHMLVLEVAAVAAAVLLRSAIMALQVQACTVVAVVLEPILQQVDVVRRLCLLLVAVVAAG